MSDIGRLAALDMALPGPHTVGSAMRTRVSVLSP